LDEEEGKAMNISQQSEEEKGIEEIVGRLNHLLTGMKRLSDYSQGLVDSGGSTEIDRVLTQTVIEIINTFTFLQSEVERSLIYILKWVHRVERQSEQNSKLLLTLLGLSPNASSQEITEAIDDIGPLFAKYRHDKRGT
jgi:hypothetical protein